MGSATDVHWQSDPDSRPGTSSYGTLKPKAPRQELLNANSLKMLQFSVESLGKAAFHPYVIDKFKRAAQPILLSTAAVYVIGLALLLPIEAIAYLIQLLSLGSISHGAIAGVSRSWLRETVSLVPFLALLLMRNLIRKPLYKCFIHLLREINPPTAAVIEQLPQDKKVERQRRRLARTIQKVAILIILELVLHVARKSPWLGRPAVVILWRSSSVLGQEIIADFTSTCVPPNDRKRFFKSHDVDIPLFALPGAFLIQIPIVGPLFFIWVQASAAYLVSKFSRDVELPAPSKPPQGSAPSATGAPKLPATSPTLPSGPAPTIANSKAL